MGLSASLTNAHLYTLVLSQAHKLFLQINYVPHGKKNTDVEGTFRSGVESRAHAGMKAIPSKNIGL